MDSIKISQLDVTDTIQDMDYFVVLQNDATKRVPMQVLKTPIVNDIKRGGAKSALSAEQGKILAKRISDLEYFPIAINSLTIDTPIVEMGTTVSKLFLSWTLNKNPKTQHLDGQEVPITQRNYLLNKTITTTTNLTLRVTDERETPASKTATIQFLNGVYYGVSSSEIIDSRGILTLHKELSNSKSRTFSVNCGVNDHIYYCLPSRLGACTFFVGGFEGGFTKTSTISFVNSSGYSENYDIYKSNNKNLGNTTVKVQ